MLIGPREPGPKFPNQPDLVCPECGQAMRLIETGYPDHPYGYRCIRGGCPGWHGAHPDGSPLGVPGDRKTKAARMAAHAVFDRLWKDGYLTRKQAYAALDAAMALPSGSGHFGSFTAEQCEKATQWAQERLDYEQRSSEIAKGKRIFVRGTRVNSNQLRWKRPRYGGT